jgi:hypothetical protein
MQLGSEGKLSHLRDDWTCFYICNTLGHIGGTGRIRYQVPHFWVIIIFNFPPCIYRFTGPTTHRSKQETIPQGANELKFGFRA